MVWLRVAPSNGGEKTRNVDFYDMKADVESLLKNKEVSFEDRTSGIAPRTCRQYRFRRQSSWFCRRVASEMAAKYDLPQAPLVFEIDMDAVLTREKPVIRPYPNSSLHAEIWHL